MPSSNPFTEKAETRKNPAKGHSDHSVYSTLKVYVHFENYEKTLSREISFTISEDSENPLLGPSFPDAFGASTPLQTTNNHSILLNLATFLQRFLQVTKLSLESVRSSSQHLIKHRDKDLTG